MLKLNKTRQITAEFLVHDEDQDKLVKTTNINMNNQGVSEVTETMYNADLYNKYRKEMRKDEQALRQLRYSIEDDIMAENEKDNQEE